jgi:hypothetical protein
VALTKRAKTSRVPSATKTDSVRRIMEQISRERAYEALERAYSAYSGNPTRALGFSALRALVRFCRWSGFDINAARIFAELARVDAGATFPFQLVLKCRVKTEAMRRHSKEASCETLRQRNIRLFNAVIRHVAEHGGALPDAYGEVASDTELSEETVRKAYQKIAKTFRDDGSDEALVRSVNYLGDILLPKKFLPLPAQGRPRTKIGKS